MQIWFPSCGAHARSEIVSNCKQICALTISLQIIHLSNGISQESDPKSQDEVPVRSSFGKNFECYVQERYLKKIFVVGFCGWRISSGHTEREVQLRMFASYRSLELALLFSIYTNKQFEALKSLDTYS